MRRVLSFLLAAAVLTTPGFAAMDPAITGDYVEVRTSDIYTGPCFANGEVNLTGKEAIMAWRVRSGKWDGVNLDGLSVVAVVKANSTLGDPYASPDPAKAVLVVDERADAPQRLALSKFAREMAGSLLENVVATESAPIELEMGGIGEATLKAGQYAELSTRALNHHDHLCGNEIVYYPPLTEVEATPAYTKSHWYRGPGLNGNWSSPFKRSAFVGVFAR